MNRRLISLPPFSTKEFYKRSAVSLLSSKVKGVSGYFPKESSVPGFFLSLPLGPVRFVSFPHFPEDEVVTHFHFSSPVLFIYLFPPFFPISS